MAYPHQTRQSDCRQVQKFLVWQPAPTDYIWENNKMPRMCTSRHLFAWTTYEVQGGQDNYQERSTSLRPLVHIGLVAATIEVSCIGGRLWQMSRSLQYTWHSQTGSGNEANLMLIQAKLSIVRLFASKRLQWLEDYLFFRGLTASTLPETCHFVKMAALLLLTSEVMIAPAVLCRQEIATLGKSALVKPKLAWKHLVVCEALNFGPGPSHILGLRDTCLFACFTFVYGLDVLLFERLEPEGKAKDLGRS